MAIKRAFLSVFDKSGIVELATRLQNLGVELVSSGGTARLLQESGLAVTPVEDLTGFPAMFGGRVKTLHPKIHGGILYRRDNEQDVADAEKWEIPALDMVVVNLYPFQQTIAKPDTSFDEAIEMIDIGGPGMLRAAAKNHPHVLPLVHPEDFEPVLLALEEQGDVSFEERRRLALRAFAATAEYDVAISSWLGEQCEQSEEVFTETKTRYMDLRYGENPHQQATVFGEIAPAVEILHGKKLSYNNIVDLQAALELMGEFETPACSIIKHTNPCGVGMAQELSQAWELAFATDRTSPFGGIITVNRELDLATAKAIDSIFSELVVAPAYAADALALLKKKKNRRLVSYDPEFSFPDRQYRSFWGGTLVQDRDTIDTVDDKLQIVSQRQPTEAEWQALRLAWRVVKHVKSNAIVFTAADRTLAIGAGQMSRVDSARIAVAKATGQGIELKGSALGSDAFFPFADGIEEAAAAGVTAVIQPGGSVRDEEVIAAADKAGLAMVFTGIRHFKH
jgi:phosphoribosylaminoimidazolecarboxamide formyltransferase/IMP cyclohydrolase